MWFYGRSSVIHELPRGYLCFPCFSPSESNDRVLEEFTQVVTLADLKVNLGRWKWSPTS